MAVALRKESVDRNPIRAALARPCVVALRKESVDRNGDAWIGLDSSGGSLSARRAWIETCIVNTSSYTIPSLSARRAWIETKFLGTFGNAKRVALRKESVDRNGRRNVHGFNLRASLSARRAWIEIWSPAHMGVAS